MGGDELEVFSQSFVINRTICCILNETFAPGHFALLIKSDRLCYTLTITVESVDDLIFKILSFGQN